MQYLRAIGRGRTEPSEGAAAESLSAYGRGVEAQVAKILKNTCNCARFVIF